MPVIILEYPLLSNDFVAVTGDYVKKLLNTFSADIPRYVKITSELKERFIVNLDQICR